MWTPIGWMPNVTISVDVNGRIVAVTNNSMSEHAEFVDGWCVPSLVNAHSHAFQYAMAGTAENRGDSVAGANDSFWTWRETMYKLAAKLMPEDMRAIAARAYAQMVQNGFGRVVEFHYLHHPVQGGADSQLNVELALAISDAAAEAGIGLTLVPVYYQLGGFNRPAEKHQQRFVFRNVDHYLRYRQKIGQEIKNCPDVHLGYGVHSLRAAGADDIRAVLGEAKRHKLPFHIHIGEQVKEVEDCRAHYGTSPVAWFLDQMPVDDLVSLVHATHVTETEISGVAASGATVVLCPTTEANLGDGVFPLSQYDAANARWAIGTDSHVRTSAFAELEMLEYSQRLTERRRLVHSPHAHETGDSLWDSAWRGGMQSAGQGASEPWQNGDVFRACVLNAEHPVLSSAGLEKALSVTIFAPEQGHLLGSISGGSWLVRRGQHTRQSTIDSHYRECLRRVHSLNE